MANHASAEKRHRQNLKRRANNRAAKSTINLTIKKALVAKEGGNSEEALSNARLANKLLDKAVVHGVLHKKQAARRISRLFRKIA